MFVYWEELSLQDLHVVIIIMLHCSNLVSQTSCNQTQSSWETMVWINKGRLIIIMPVKGSGLTLNIGTRFQTGICHTPTEGLEVPNSQPKW